MEVWYRLSVVVFFCLPYCISLFIVHHLCSLTSVITIHHVLSATTIPPSSPTHHAPTIITQPYHHRHHSPTHLTPNISPAPTTPLLVHLPPYPQPCYFVPLHWRPLTRLIPPAVSSMSTPSTFSGCRISKAEFHFIWICRSGMMMHPLTTFDINVTVFIQPIFDSSRGSFRGSLGVIVETFACCVTER